MSKKIMLLSLGSLAVATAVAVPVAVVLSGDSAKATTTGGAGTTPTPTTTGEPGKTGTTGGVKMPLKSTAPKLVSRHFDTAAEFNKHPFVTDVEVAKDGTEKEIVDQTGDFGRNEFIFANGNDLTYLLGASTLDEINKAPFSFLEQMRVIIVEAIEDSKYSATFPEAKKAIDANNLASKPTDDAAVISVNLARLKGSTTADSIVVNINHASWSDAKKILKAAKEYLERDVDQVRTKLKFQAAKKLIGVLSTSEWNQVADKIKQKETITTLEGLFDRLINSI